MNLKTKIVVFTLLGIAVVGGGVWYLSSKAGKKENGGGEDSYSPPVVYRKPLGTDEVPFPEGKGDPGLRISDETRQGLSLEVKEAVEAKDKRALPPQLGTTNFDNETMFQIKPRFQGELISLKQIEETVEFTVDGSTRTKKVPRPIKFGDKVEQGDILASFWSVTLGTQKATFVDAISALRLSQDALQRQEKLFYEGALPLATYEQAKRQVRADNNSLLTAERTLRMWKLTDTEIEALRAEANEIIDSKKPRNIVDEVQRWAYVPVKVPVFDQTQEGKERKLTILEKNTNVGDIVDQANYGTTLFRLADMSRLQIWVHPPEEYLPVIRKGLEGNGHGTGKPKWHIRFQADPADKPPLVLTIDRIAPSLEPNQHNPMVIGYLDNKDYQYLVGQAVIATLFVDPEKDTVEIPTDALNEIKGQSYVFVKDDKNKNEYSCRRVAVVQRFKDFSVIRSKLTNEQKNFSIQEVKQGRWPLRPLLPNDLVVTRGVVELTTALENLLTNERAKELANKN